MEVKYNLISFKNLIHCTFRLVLLGPNEAGKISMVESLIAGEAVLVQIEEEPK